MAGRFRPPFSSTAPTTVRGDIHGADEDTKGRELVVSLGRLKESLSEVGCELTGKELTTLFLCLDKAGRGEVR